ncbi:unnamed protein product [Rotaria magnacalcarata]|uniref:Uncharacterized protein n=2 Tax=Rotaria magnacalcarata TaxID=392030 RepID=A0A815KVU4_9BILA|nr:unnamed protein product [Rotaria magnacalcarata]CAF4098195.1 unnamed protein product [Rotaria magnacalcarata]
MDSLMETSQLPLVVFGPGHIDTSRAEMLVQCLSNKIKEKRFKLQKLVGINEDKKKHNELMGKEKIQLTTKLTNIEHENSVREQQLLTEQLRIKEIQFNIQMLDDHNSSIKRDYINEERKYDQEKSLLINKFEHIKQQWTEIFKPQYEQSKVYQYLKQGDLAYNSLVERQEVLRSTQNLAYKHYSIRRQEFCNEKHFQSSILSIAKCFISRRDQFIQIEKMKEKLLELESKQKQLIESKIDKMKAWESVYTQPVKRDLLDFCLQTNIDQALTFSFNQIQEDIWSQPMTPVIGSILTPQNEQIELVPIEQTNNKSFVTTQSTIPTIIIDETTPEVVKPSPHQKLASTIVVAASTTENTSIHSNRTSVLHLSTAIDDDDDDEEFFLTSHRKTPIPQMEQMSIKDCPPSTQAFTVSAVTTNSSIDVNEEVSFISSSDQQLTQTFALVSTPTQVESIPVRDIVTSITDNQVSESISILSSDTIVNKLHSTVTFQLPPFIIQNRLASSVTSSIQPQVTSSDVQQMLLTFSPEPSSINEEQLQPMEDYAERLQQQRPTFTLPSSIESITSTQNGYTNFNYNFGFDDDNKAGDVTAVNGGNFTSPINFSNWSNLGSPLAMDSADQFPVFMQNQNISNNGVDTSFSFTSFNFGGVAGDGGETSTNSAFGSFFFGNDGSPMNTELGQEKKQ